MRPAPAESDARAAYGEAAYARAAYGEADRLAEILCAARS